MVGNKNGCYEVLYRPVGDGNILYTDYASKSRIYLSSRITGEHNNESDSSWLKSTVGGCYFSLTSEYLILFKLNTPAFADSETDMQRGYIAKYDLDGSNRQILTWLAPNETIADTTFCVTPLNSETLKQMPHIVCFRAWNYVPKIVLRDRSFGLLFEFFAYRKTPSGILTNSQNSRRRKLWNILNRIEIVFYQSQWCVLYFCVKFIS